MEEIIGEVFTSPIIFQMIVFSNTKKELIKLSILIKDYRPLS